MRHLFTLFLDVHVDERYGVEQSSWNGSKNCAKHLQLAFWWLIGRACTLLSVRRSTVLWLRRYRRMPTIGFMSFRRQRCDERRREWAASIDQPPVSSVGGHFQTKLGCGDPERRMMYMIYLCSCRGEVMGVKCSFSITIFDAFTVECFAIRTGLLLARAHGFKWRRQRQIVWMWSRRFIAIQRFTSIRSSPISVVYYPSWMVVLVHMLLANETRWHTHSLGNHFLSKMKFIEFLIIIVLLLVICLLVFNEKSDPLFKKAN